MRRRLYLLRHAEVSYLGAPDPTQVSLTPRGLEQAAAVRAALAGVEFDLVVSSTMPRSIETAEAVAPNGPLEPWPELVEWRSGKLVDVAPEELESTIVRALLVREEHERFLGGESLGEAIDRVHGALETLLAREWSTALVVLHGGVNRLILSYALTGGGRAYYGNIEQAYACINVLDIAGREWVVRTVNYVTYDPLPSARTTAMEDQWVELKEWLESR